MRTIVAAMAALSMLLVMPTAAQAAEIGGNRHCVSKAEFRHIHAGMKMHRVKRMTETRGRTTSVNRTGTRIERVYNACGRAANVKVHYFHKRVVEKDRRSASGGRHRGGADDPRPHH